MLTGNGEDIKGLTVVTPDKSRRLLIENLDVAVRQGERLLVVGPSGTGKSSLLRAIAGLWTVGEGRIVRQKDTMFLPQRPYCTLGTLREQLTYPAKPDVLNVSDAKLLEILAQVDLLSLAVRFDSELRPLFMSRFPFPPLLDRRRDQC